MPRNEQLADVRVNVLGWTQEKLATVAANRRVAVHYRRFAAKSPFAQSATLPLTCGFTLKSSSPLQRIATSPERRHR